MGRRARRGGPGLFQGTSFDEYAQNRPTGGLFSTVPESIRRRGPKAVRIWKRNQSAPREARQEFYDRYISGERSEEALRQVQVEAQGYDPRSEPGISSISAMEALQNKLGGIETPFGTLRQIGDAANLLLGSTPGEALEPTHGALAAAGTAGRGRRAARAAEEAAEAAGRAESLTPTLDAMTPEEIRAGLEEVERRAATSPRGKSLDRRQNAEPFEGPDRRTGEDRRSATQDAEDQLRGLVEAQMEEARRVGGDLGATGSGDPLAAEDDIRRGLIERIERGRAAARAEAEQLRKQAESTVDVGLPGTWVSPTLRGLADVKQQVAPAEQWKGILTKQPGSRELREYIGLDDWLDSRAGEKITKEEVQGFIRENMPRFTETTKSATRGGVRRTPEELQPEIENLQQQARVAQAQGDQVRAEQLFRESEDLMLQQEEIAGFGPEGTPKFESYTLPGGENYRETLIQLEGPGQVMERSVGPNAPRDDALFRSPHWDEPNVLAHLRTTDRDVGGDKTLMIEEIQSDWHQAGRKRGYAGDVDPVGERVRGYLEEAQGYFPNTTEVDLRTASTLPSSQARLQEIFGDRLPQVIEDLNRTRRNPQLVSNAPFKRTEDWVAMSFRRALQDAAEGGYDRVAWVSGEQAADMYDLRQQVSRIEWDEDQGLLRAFDHDGDAVIEETVRRPEELAEYIGKEPAQRLVEGQPQVNEAIEVVTADDYVNRFGNFRGSGLGPDDEFVIMNTRDNELLWTGRDLDSAEAMLPILQDEGGLIRSIEGDDLAVGGEGMDTFYNRIVPNVVKKEAKRLGVEIEPVVVRDALPAELKDVMSGVHAPSMRTEQGSNGLWQVVSGNGEVLRDGLSQQRARVLAREAMDAQKTDPTNLSIRLTPEARDKILNEGQRLGTTTVGGAAVAGATAAGAAVGVPLILQALQKRQEQPTPPQRTPEFLQPPPNPEPGFSPRLTGSGPFDLATPRERLNRERRARRAPRAPRND